jgi:hypothetical protein
MTEFEAQVLADLRVLKSQMDELLGIGQPGRLNHLEGRVDGQERSLQRIKGFAAAGGALLTLVQIAMEYFRR